MRCWFAVVELGKPAGDAGCCQGAFVDWHSGEE